MATIVPLPQSQSHTVHIHLSDGGVIQCVIYPLTTTIQLKNELFSSYMRIRFIFLGRQLNDHDPLMVQGVIDGSHVHCAVSPLYDSSELAGSAGSYSADEENGLLDASDRSSSDGNPLPLEIVRSLLFAHGEGDNTDAVLSFITGFFLPWVPVLAYIVHYPLTFKHLIGFLLGTLSNVLCNIVLSIILSVIEYHKAT